MPITRHHIAAMLLFAATGAQPALAQTTGAIPVQNMQAALNADIGPLKRGLDLVTADRWDQARAARNALTPGSLDRQIMDWVLAIYGTSNIPSAEIAAAAHSLQGWPGGERMRANSERALASEKRDARTIIAAFGNTSPETIEGAMALAGAQLETGNRAAAAATLSPWWRKEKLEPAEESAILSRFGSVLSRADHCSRFEAMHYAERVTSAGRVAGLCGSERLHDAWSKVTRGDSGAWSALSAVPQNARTGGFYFAKARFQRRAGDFRDAAATMLEAPAGADSIDADAWWVERRVLARELLDINEPRLAYRVAAAQQQAGGAYSIMDGAFHAGWIALRFLNDPNTAHRHFQTIVQTANRPISNARGYYWLGRAAEVGAPGNARDYYSRAAKHDFTYYGQLAREKLGQKTLAAAFPSPTDADRRNFASRRAVAAIKRLEQAGHEHRGNRLYMELAEELDSVGELAMLAVQAEHGGDYRTALRIGKLAAYRGLEVGALAHPVGAIPANAQISGSGKALAYAIARQESEFNHAAVSHVGARGLLQLMPATAKQMASQTGLAYSSQRLVTDPAYNATLGAAYLGDQLARFSGSYVLTFVGYNAGPSRATEWVSRYGDPRGADIDTVVDWVERIPFTETRNYVQRVMENYQVYRMRLTGTFQIEEDLRNGR